MNLLDLFFFLRYRFVMQEELFLPFSV